MKSMHVIVLIIFSIFTQSILANSCQTQQSGNWSDQNTWVACGGMIPQDNDSVVIKTGDSVLLDQNTSNLAAMIVDAGGDFNVAAPGFVLNANTAGADIDLSNATILLEGDLVISAQAHNILMGEVDGNFALTLDSQGETRLIGTIGGNMALSALTTDAAGTTVLANVNGSASVATVVVDGDRIFDGPVLLAEYTNIQGNGGVITFNSTLDSETSTDEALAITFASNVDISFNGKVGNINRLERLQIINSVSSTSFINASEILTNRNQRWGTDIVIDSPTNQLLMNVGINGTVKIGSSGANHSVRSLVANTESLTIESPDVVSIFSTVGDNNQALNNFSIDSASTAIFDGSSINVSGTQTYTGAVELSKDLLLMANSIDMQGDVNNAGFDLTLDAVADVLTTGIFSGSGDIVKQGAGDAHFTQISSLTGDLYIKTGILYNDTNFESVFPNIFTFHLTSGAFANLGSSTTNIFSLEGGQTLTGDGACLCRLDAKNGATISPGFGVGSMGILYGINLQTGSIVDIDINGNAATTEYDQLTSSGGAIDLDSNSLGGATLNISLGNGFVPSIGNQFKIVETLPAILLKGAFNGLAEGSVLNIDGTLFSISYVGGNGNDVKLTTTGQICETGLSGNWSDANTWINCNGGIPQDGYSVIINDTHIVTLDQDTALLDGITVVAGGDLNVSGNYSLMADASGADFDLQNASIDLLGDLTIDANGHKILLGSVDGAFGLTLNSSAETRLTGIIGGTTPLTSLITDSGGTTVFADTNGGANNPNVYISDLMQLNNPVLLAANTSFAGNHGITNFNNTLDSESGNMGITIRASDSSITFNGDIGSNNLVSSFRIVSSNNSTVEFNLSQVNTKGVQIWDTNLILNTPGNNVSLTSSNGGLIRIGTSSNFVRSQIDGEETLSINTSGTVTINSTIGDNSQRLSDFTLNSVSSAMINSSEITVTDTQSYTGPVTFGANSILSANIVDIQSTVDNGGFDLTFNISSFSPASNMSGVLSGSGDFIKNGSGRLNFDSVNTISGDILHNQGYLVNNFASDTLFPNIGVLSLANNTTAEIGDPTSRDFQLSSNQSIIGEGNCFCNLIINNGATVSPGFSPGKLSSEQLFLDTGSVLSIEINGNIAGTEYDQVTLFSGGSLDANSLGGATLDLSIGFIPMVGDGFKIIDTDTGITGTFNGLTEGSKFVVQDQLFSITYVGGDGNDVVLIYEGTSIIHVDANAALAGDGKSWATAFNNLQDALAIAVSGTEIWIAEGVYYPDVGTVQVDNDRLETFSLIDGVSVYGGFAGIETELIQRDPTTNITILSGDIDGDDINTDANTIAETVADIQGSNAYHVLNGQNITVSTAIDGLTVTAGSATVASPIDGNGGGMLCNDTDGPSINNMVFIGNAAFGLGGASFGCDSNVSNSQYLSNESSKGGAIFSKSARFENVQFKGNSSTSQSGGALVVYGNLYLENVLFMGNNSADAGGAVFVGSSGSNQSLVLINVTMTGNQSVSAGAGIKVASSGTFDISNSIIWNNQYGLSNGTASASIDSNLPINNSYSLIQGFGTTGTLNLDEDPLFITDTNPTTAPTINGNARLMYVSNAIDAGDDTAVTILLDLDGNDRIQDTAVDMGAYEFTDLIYTNGFE